MAKRVMNELKLSRIAAVDNPCQEGAKAAIFKRAQEIGGYLAKGANDAALPDAVEAYLKRDFSGDKRKELADTGAALPDGSFPIQTRGDLKNAVGAYGRAKNKPKAKAHIVSRARSLDATSLLPADWKISKLQLLGDVTNDLALDGFEKSIELFIEDMGACDFEGAQAECEAREYANALLCEIDDAVCSLRTCFYEIEGDRTITDREEALQESLTQFKAHIQGIIPEGVENALVAKALEEAGFEITEGGALTKRENDDMGASIELKKSLGLPVTANDADVAAAVAKQAAKAEFSDNVLKMSPEHIAYMQKGENLPDGGKEIFAKMTPAQRDEVLKKFPPAMSDDEKKAKEKKDMDDADAKKRADELAKAADETLTVDGAEIRKSIVGPAVFAVMKSQQAAIEKAADERAMTVIEKRATIDLAHIGKASELATMLHGIAKRDPKLSEQVEAVLKAADAKIAKGGLLKEVGKSSTGQGAGSAAAQIEALAVEKISKGEAKNIFKARDLVRKANPELEKQEAEESKKKAA